MFNDLAIRNNHYSSVFSFKIFSQSFVFTVPYWRSPSFNNKAVSVAEIMLVNPVQLVCTRERLWLHVTIPLAPVFIRLHPASCHPSLALTGSAHPFSSGHTLKQICEMMYLKEPTYHTVLNTIFIILFLLKSVASRTFENWHSWGTAPLYKEEQEPLNYTYHCWICNREPWVRLKSMHCVCTSKIQFSS